MLVKNAWYVAGWSDEIGRETLVSRTLVGERVVMYRLENGDPVALHDRCPHRFVPLHVGKLKGDVLECGYHGLQFAASGGCVFNPHGDGKISSNMQVRSFPVADRDGLVWIWVGDPALADPAKIVSLPFLADTERFTTVRGHMHVACNFQLINDNLLDPSHTQYVHPLFLRAKVEGAPPREEFDTGQDGNTTWTTKTTYDVKPIPFAAMFTDLQRVDAFVDNHWYGPSVTFLDIGTKPPGAPRDGPGTNLTPNMHLVTPETDTTTHYFWTMSRNRRLDDEELSRQVWEGINHAFANEDKPLLEMQQRELGTAELLERRPVLLQNDTVAMRARRIVQAMFEAEQSPAVARVLEPAE